MNIFIFISRPVSGFLIGIGIGQLMKDGSVWSAAAVTLAFLLFLIREFHYILKYDAG